MDDLSKTKPPRINLTRKNMCLPPNPILFVEESPNDLQDGPLPAINGVITPIIRIITGYMLT